MENMPPEPAPAFQIPGVSPQAPIMPVLTKQAQEYLNQTRPWVRFLSIMVFLGAALMALGGLGLAAAMMVGGLGASGARTPFGAVAGGGVLGFFYLMMACLYVAPAVFMSRYAGAIKQLKETCSADALEEALKHQKSFWRFMGILTVIGLVIFVLFLGIAVVAGVFGLMMAGRR